MKRVVVIGATGSGKSTFAARLARRLDLPLIELDDLFWLPDWVQVPEEEFAARVRDAAAADEWVISGNYLSRVAHDVWCRADTLVWLDLPLPVVLWRSVSRTVRRSLTREVVCNGNRERLRYLLPPPLGPDTPLWQFAYRFYRGGKREEVETMLADHPHLTVHRLRTRAAVGSF